jgi:hypothetical protein
MKFYRSANGRTGFFSDQGAQALVNLFPDMIFAATHSGQQRGTPAGQKARTHVDVGNDCGKVKAQLTTLLAMDSFMLHKIFYAYGKQYIGELEESLGLPKQEQGGTEQGSTEGGAAKKDEELSNTTSAEAKLDIRLNGSRQSAEDPDRFTKAEQADADEFMKEYFPALKQGSDHGFGWTPRGICAAIISEVIKNNETEARRENEELGDKFKYKYHDVTDHIFGAILGKLGFYELGSGILPLYDKVKGTKMKDLVFANQLLALTCLVTTQEHNERIEGLTKKLDKEQAEKEGKNASGVMEQNVEAGFGACMRQIQTTFEEVIRRGGRLRETLANGKEKLRLDHQAQLMARRSIKRCYSMVQQPMEVEMKNRRAERERLAKAALDNFEACRVLTAGLLRGTRVGKESLYFLDSFQAQVTQLEAKNQEKDRQIVQLTALVEQELQEKTKLITANAESDRQKENLAEANCKLERQNQELVSKLCYERKYRKLSSKLTSYKELRGKEAHRAMRNQPSQDLNNHKIGGGGDFTYGDKMQALNAFEAFVSERSHELDTDSIGALANKRLSDIIVPYVRQRLVKINLVHPWQLASAIRDLNRQRAAREEGRVHGKKAIITLWAEREKAQRATELADRGPQRETRVMDTP